MNAKTTDQPSFPQTVWDTLSRLDVSDHTDQIDATAKRPAVTYLSWSNAWTLLKRNFPASTYAHRSDLHHTDGTVEVEVDVVISKDGTSQQFTNARLGVMGFYFDAIPNPTARQINDARQRALVKALAFAGLGLNLWSDSSIPVGRMEDPITEVQVQALNSLIEATGTDPGTFLEWCECVALEDLPRERYPAALNLLKAKQGRQKAEASEAKLRAGK